MKHELFYESIGLSYEEAVKYGIASGSASAFSKAIATKEDVTKLYLTL